MVVRTLIYGSVCLFNNVTNTKSLENVQKYCTKWISNDRTSNYQQLLLKWRILPLSLYLQLQDILFWQNFWMVHLITILINIFVSPKKDELMVFGSPLGPKSEVDLLEGENNVLENVNRIVEKLDSHYRVFIMKNCFSLQKLWYLLRTSTCLNHPALLEKYDKTVRDGLSKVCNVNFADISSTQLALPDKMGGLVVSSASLLALSAFLVSAFVARDFLRTIFSETFEDVSFTKALEN